MEPGVLRKARLQRFTVRPSSGKQFLTQIAQTLTSCSERVQLFGGHCPDFWVIQYCLLLCQQARHLRSYFTKTNFHDLTILDGIELEMVKIGQLFYSDHRIMR
jgi:hypothetical protein